MDDWLARYAAALAYGLPEDAPSVDLGQGGDSAVRELATLVGEANGPENAALATFLAGVYVALKAGAGVGAESAMDEAVRVARRILSEAADPAS